MDAGHPATLDDFRLENAVLSQVVSDLQAKLQAAEQQLAERQRCRQQEVRVVSRQPARPSEEVKAFEARLEKLKRRSVNDRGERREAQKSRLAASGNSAGLAVRPHAGWRWLARPLRALAHPHIPANVPLRSAAGAGAAGQGAAAAAAGGGGTARGRADV